jgi:hypothetical protein
MTNAKPKEEFKHVKVLSLNELNGYIKYLVKYSVAKKLGTYSSF